MDNAEKGPDGREVWAAATTEMVKLASRQQVDQHRQAMPPLSTDRASRAPWTVWRAIYEPLVLLGSRLL